MGYRKEKDERNTHLLDRFRKFSEAVRRKVLGKVSGNVLMKVSDEVSRTVSGEVLMKVSGEVSGEVSRTVSGKVLRRMSGEVSGKVLRKVSEEVSAEVLRWVSGFPDLVFPAMCLPWPSRLKETRSRREKGPIVLICGIYDLVTLYFSSEKYWICYGTSVYIYLSEAKFTFANMHPIHIRKKKWCPAPPAPA